MFSYFLRSSFLCWPEAAFVGMLFHPSQHPCLAHPPPSSTCCQLSGSPPPFSFLSRNEWRWVGQSPQASFSSLLFVVFTALLLLKPACIITSRIVSIFLWFLLQLSSRGSERNFPCVPSASVSKCNLDTIATKRWRHGADAQMLWVWGINWEENCFGLRDWSDATPLSLARVVDAIAWRHRSICSEKLRLLDMALSRCRSVVLRFIAIYDAAVFFFFWKQI